MTKLKTIIEAYSIKLELINDSTMELLRQWRNQDDIRNQMVEQAIISPEQHLSWYNKVKHAQNQQHFVIYYKNQPVGAINIRSLNGENLEKSTDAEVGLYIAEDKYKGNILAFSPSLAINDYAFHQLGIKTLSSKVRQDNISAIKYNKQLGYCVSEPSAGFVDISLVEIDYQAASKKLKLFLTRGSRAAT